MVSPCRRQRLGIVRPSRNKEREGMHPTDKAARVAGAVYLSMIVTAPFSLVYIPSTLFVRVADTATANNMLAHQTLFCLAIVADLFTAVIFTCLFLALYLLLSAENKPHASLV